LKEAKEEIERFVAVVENCNDFVGMTTLEGTTFYVNPAGRRLVGLSESFPAPATRLADFYPRPNTWMGSEFLLPRVIQAGWWEGEAALRNLRTGAEIDTRENLFLVRHPRSGAPLCIATVAQDITARKQGEAALWQSKEAAEASSRARSHFLANMSHEI